LTESLIFDKLIPIGTQETYEALSQFLFMGEILYETI